MTSRFRPFSCDCVINVDLNELEVRCNLHKLGGGATANEVKNHNLRWTVNYETNPNEAENEKQAIRRQDFSLVSPSGRTSFKIELSLLDKFKRFFRR